MKIALIAPSPVPFTIGGAEKVAWGLLEYINQETSHQAELIKLPSRELSFWDLVDSYHSFWQLDLSHFDAVVSSKYPAWMARHPRHIVYLLHRLRGLYDTYPPLPPACDSALPTVAALTSFLRGTPRTASAISPCFDLLEDLRAGAPSLPPELFAFPGPLIREIIHFLDDCAFAPPAISRYAAISRNVARRPGYFPPGIEAAVLYPPTDLPSLRSGDYGYFLSVGRLDNAKRTRLAIEAMLASSAELPLKIAGTGPEEADLRRLAAKDPRIEFLGFVRDRDAIDLYANCLAALYVPYDEDYGLVTVEAMGSGKPVLTTADSGGPNEFVVPGETGFSVAPSAAALAERIDYLASHIAEVRAMAPACRARVSGIAWTAVAEGLFGPDASQTRTRSSPTRRRVTVAITFPVYPPRGGGKSRVYHLYRALAAQLDCDIDLVTVADDGQESIEQTIAPGLREIRVAKSAAHSRREARLSVRAGRVPITDVAMPALLPLSPGYLDALRRSASTSCLLVACHPYMLPALEAVRGSQPLMFEAHNVELSLKRRTLPDNPIGRYLVRLTREIERQCCLRSSLISVCSNDDGASLESEYGASRSDIVLVPNGVDLESITFRPLAGRAPNPGFRVLFMGSWHEPNIEAALHIAELARLMPEVQFQILGSVCQYFRVYQWKLPSNIQALGVVDDLAKDRVLGAADLAINPMESGSGSNLKILDYMAAGTPVLSTPFGARGLDLENGEHVLLAPLTRFPEAIAGARRTGAGLSPMTLRARALVESRYSWPSIAAGLARSMANRFAGLAR